MANLRFSSAFPAACAGSHATAVRRCAAKSLPAGVDFEVADLTDILFFNADVAAQGKPAGVARVCPDGRRRRAGAGLSRSTTIRSRRR